MFYSYELLCRKPNGRFAVIWLLSNSRKVSDRKVMTVSIPDMVHDVREYIVRGFPDHLPVHTGSRFSLYLSTKLCYGIVLALKTQLKFLTRELNTLCLYTTPSSTESSRRGRHGVTTGRDEEPHIKRQKTHERSYEMVIDPTTEIPSLEDLGIDIIYHLEVNGATVRAPEESITLRDEVVFDQQLGEEGQGFGEIRAEDLERHVLSCIGEEGVPVPQEQPPAHGEPSVPVSETEQLPETHVETETRPADPTQSQIPVIVTAPVYEQHPSPSQTPAVQPCPAVPPTPGVQPPTLGVQPPTPAAQPPTPAAQPQTPAVQPPTPAVQPPTPAVQPPTPAAQPPTPAVQPPTPAVQPPTPAVQPPTPSPRHPPTPTPRARRISAPPLIPDQDVEVTLPTRRRQTRSMRLQDEQLQISSQDMRNRLQFWEDTMRVQNAAEDQVNVDKHWYIIPTPMSLGTVRNALLPNVLKNLLTRHRYTHEMLNESLQEVSQIQETASTSASFGSSLHPLHPGSSVRPERSPVASLVLETITEGAEVGPEVNQAQRDVVAEGVPQEPPIVVQNLPPQECVAEELSTVQPQEEPEIRVAASVGEVTGPERSEVQLELDASKMEQTLQVLWVTGSPVTFSRICPPDSTDRITALETFELLLNMDHLGMIRLRQSLHSCPPTCPRAPIVILPPQ